MLGNISDRRVQPLTTEICSRVCGINVAHNFIEQHGKRPQQSGNSTVTAAARGGGGGGGGWHLSIRHGFSPPNIIIIDPRLNASNATAVAKCVANLRGIVIPSHSITVRPSPSVVLRRFRSMQELTRRESPCASCYPVYPQRDSVLSSFPLSRF